MPTNPKAEKIIATCKELFPSKKANCNEFAIAVAAKHKIILTGNADQIVDQIQDKTKGWIIQKDSKEAAARAEEGYFVIGGLKAKDHVPSEGKPPVVNGHVVIVVAGPLAKDKYPTAWWGSNAGVFPEPGKETVNYAWNKNTIDKVKYSAKLI